MSLNPSAFLEVIDDTNQEFPNDREFQFSPGKYKW